MMLVVRKILALLKIRDFAEENAETLTVLSAGNPPPAPAHPGTNAIPYSIHLASSWVNIFLRPGPCPASPTLAQVGTAPL